MLCLALTGCAKPQLNPVSYDRSVATTSGKTAEVVLVGGQVTGGTMTTVIPAGSVFVPIVGRSVPHDLFDLQDQQTFATSFRSELERLKLFRSATGSTPADCRITLTFRQTQHNPAYHGYILDVGLEIVGGREVFRRTYRVDSAEGMSAWQRGNTYSYEGKGKAATMLLRRMIPDIEAWLTANR